MPCGVSRSADDKRNISLIVTRSSASSKWDHIAFSEVCVLHKWARIAQSVYQLAKSRTVRGSNTGVCEIFRTIPDLPWDSHSLIYNGYRATFPRRTRRGLNHPPWAHWIKKEYSYTSTSLWVSYACPRVKCNFLLFTCILCKGRQNFCLKVEAVRSSETSINFYNKTTVCRCIHDVDLQSQRSCSVYINLPCLMNLDFW